MSARVAAWSLAVFGVALIVTSHVLDGMNGHRFAPPVVGTIVVIAFLVVGALIASHRPRNPIGWIYLVGLTFVAFGGSRNVSDQYAIYALVTNPGSLPAAAWVLWIGQILLIIGFFSVVCFSLLLFPDGRLPSRRWRPVVVGAVIALVLITVENALTHEGLRAFGIVVANPTGVEDAGALLEVLGISSLVLGVGVALACLTSPFIRFRAATGVARQQLKWFALGAAWIPTVGVASMILSLVAPGVLEETGSTFWPLSVAGIPIATAVAILRLRLYDIDVLINRALVYGATTAAIGAAFFLGILVLQTPLRALTGGSEIAVAASTLFCFGLFQPVRRRIQSGVDRRFYRAHYDAGQTLDAFAEGLRDEVELEAVRERLLGAVGQTMSPTHSSLWLRHR